MKMFEKLGGRKLFATLMVILIGVVVSLVKGDIPSNLTTFLEIILGTYVSGNVVKARIDSAPSNSLEELKQSNERLEQALSTVQQAMSLILQKAGIK